MRELDARIRVAIRHRTNRDEEPSQLRIGPLRVDLVRHQATYHEEPLDLTPKEFDFLAYLARNHGRVCTRRMILEDVWGPAYRNETNYLKVYAYRIRRKLGDHDGDFLRSDPSIGYRLVPPSGQRTTPGDQ
jgi:two-component system KDP operon response regulator KdpE